MRQGTKLSGYLKKHTMLCPGPSNELSNKDISTYLII